jgi:GNAT superfamily N-acetyltransferase
MVKVLHKPCVVRKASPHDASAICACLEAAFAAYRSQYTDEGFSHTVLGQDAIKDRMSAMQLFVAVSMGDIVGTIGCAAEGEDGHLRGMAVLPDWQGAGIAPALLQTAEAALRLLGCKRVVLGTTEPLERAIMFYRQHGYGPAGRVGDFFGMRLHEYEKPI